MKHVDARGNRLLESADAFRSEPEDAPAAEQDDRYSHLQARLAYLENRLAEKSAEERKKKPAQPSAQTYFIEENTVKNKPEKTPAQRKTEKRSSSGAAARPPTETQKAAPPSTKAKTVRNDPKLEAEVLPGDQFVSKVRDSNFALTKEVLQKNQENELLRDNLGKKEDELGLAAMGLDRMEMREARLLQEVELLKQQNKLLEDKVMQLRSDLQQSLNNRHSESYLLLENDALKEDVARLIKMLQTTKEVPSSHQYKNFADYADSSGSIHYLKSVGKFSRLDLAERFKDLSNLCACKAQDMFIDEKVLWVPQEAYKFAHEFRLKYDGRLTDSLIEHLLYELNKIWNQREKRMTALVKSNYNNEAECSLS